MANEWTCIAHNPQSGVSTWVTWDDEGVVIEERQDVAALLDENKALASMASDGWKGDGLHSVARAPLAMVHDDKHYLGGAMKAGDDKAVAKFLNDSENRHLRTKGGTL